MAAAGLDPTTARNPRGSPTPREVWDRSAPHRPRYLRPRPNGETEPGVSKPRAPAAPARVAAPGEIRTPAPCCHQGLQPKENPGNPDLGRSSPYSSTTRLALPALAQWGGDAAARSLRQKERWRRSHVAAPPEGAETEDAGLLPRSPFFPRALRLPPRTQNDTRHLAPTIRVLLRACKMGTKKKNLE